MGHRTEISSVKLSFSEKERLQAFCNRNFLSQSAALRQAILREIETFEAQEAQKNVLKEKA